MTKKTTKITDVTHNQDGTVKKVTTSDGRTLTPGQAAQNIDKGEDMTYKGREVQSLDGKFIRTKPDDKKGNNLTDR